MKGIILAGGNNKMMKELSNKRAIAAMPVAGSYRSIDFALSVNTTLYWLCRAERYCPTNPLMDRKYLHGNVMLQSE